MSFIKKRKQPVVSSLMESSFTTGAACGIRRVSPCTVASLLRGEYKDEVDQFFIVDCRYDFEFEGGHVQNAANLPSKSAIERFFQEHRSAAGKTVLIFHCEYSKRRGPNSAGHLRQLDRISNTYPSLTFPGLYIMEGGYKAFFEAYPDLCAPRGYISMFDPRFATLCRERTKEFKGSWSPKRIANRPIPSIRSRCTLFGVPTRSQSAEQLTHLQTLHDSIQTATQCV